MEKVGFIGLGIMGLLMAQRLLSAGYRLMVYNRTAAKADTLVDNGARYMINPKQLAENSDVIITIVSNDEAVRAVTEGKWGAFAGARPGTIFIDCSTISVKTTRDLADKAKQLGFYWLDAPVLGSVSAAKAGELTFLVGGSQEMLKWARGILEVLGKKIIRIGDNGMGQAAKLSNNLACAISLAAYSEAIILAENYGLTRKQILDVLGGPLGCALLKAKASKFEQNSFEPSFTLAMMDKDLTLALDAAEAFQLTLPALSATKKLYELAKERGFGAQDSSAVIKALEGGGL